MNPSSSIKHRKTGENIFATYQGARVTPRQDPQLKLLFGPAWNLIKEYFSSGRDAIKGRAKRKKYYVDLDNVPQHLLVRANECMETKFYQNALSQITNLHTLSNKPISTFRETITSQSSFIGRYYVIGCPGVGKTTFLNTVFSTKKKSLSYIYIDLNSINHKRIEPTLLNYLTFKGHQLTKNQLESLPSNIKKQTHIVIVFDNIDKWDSPAEELNSLAEINHLTSKLEAESNNELCTISIIVTLRRMTLARLVNGPELTRLNDPDVYLLPSPPISDVIRKRISAIRELLAPKAIESLSPVALPLSVRGSRISLPEIEGKLQVDLLCAFFEWISAEAHNYLTIASLGNIRAIRNMLIAHLFSFRTSETSLSFFIIDHLAVSNNNKDSTIRHQYSPRLYRHDLLRSVYSTPRGRIKSSTEFFSAELIYSVTGFKSWQSLLIKSRILQILNHHESHWESSKDNATSSALQIDTLFKEVNNLSYENDIITEALCSLLDNRLITTNNLNTAIISPKSKEMVFISAIGRDFLGDLFLDFGYLESTLNQVPFINAGEGDLVRPRIFTKIASLVEKIACAEAIEINYQVKAEHHPFLNLIKGKVSLATKLKANCLATLDKISRDHPSDNDGETEYNKQISLARSILDNIDNYCRDIVINEESQVNLLDFATGIVLDAGHLHDGLKGLPEFNSVSWSTEPINRVSTTAQAETLCSEIFFKFKDIRAGSVFRSIESSSRLTAAFDEVCIRTFLSSLALIQKKIKPSEYLSLNISRALFELTDPERIDKILSQISLYPNIILELPDSIGASDRITAIKSNDAFRRRLAIDDVYGLSNGTIAHFHDSAGLSMLKMLKIDHVYFQDNYNRDKDSLISTLSTMAKKCVAHDIKLVIEGVENRDHYKFLSRIVNANPRFDGTIYAQGWHFNCETIK